MSSSCSYIALRNHTPYSLLEGSIFISTLLGKAKEYSMEALGCADSGHLFGAMEFSLGCQKKDIKPLLGCRLELALHHPSYTKITSAPLVLFVKNQQGYENLCHLVTKTTVGQHPDFQGKITWEQLQGHSHGLMALTGGPKGVVDTYFSVGAKEVAQEWFQKLMALFPQNLYMELSRYESAHHGQCDEKTFWREDFLISLAHHYNVPLLATNNALFLSPEDYEAHDALRCIALTQYIQDDNREKESPFAYFRSPSEMEALFQDVPEALANTFHLAQRVDFLLTPQHPVLPSFPSQESEDTLLRRESAQGLYERLLVHFPEHKPYMDSLAFFRHYIFQEKGLLKDEPSSEAERDCLLLQGGDPHHPLTPYMDRLLYECDMIVNMGFSGYFLIVSDFIKWAKTQDIPVGPGRGSGAGVLVAWSLKITDVDPLRFQLFFERFLNPERVSMPDFDIDFCQERRDEVIRYVRDKYGQDRVASIITFGTLQARAVLRDVGRVLQMPYGQVDKICKLIPSNPNNPVHLDQAIVIEPQLKILAQEDSQVAKMLDIGLKLEGLYRHVSTHAAGVIIGREPLQKTLALYHDQESLLPATEFSMKYVESAGLVKFDFLGLKTLTILNTARKLLEKRKIFLDLTCIPLDDKKTFQLLTQVRTKGVFQLESAGMGEVLRQLEPTQFEELIALVALYRPGPMDEIPKYIACKHGREVISYTYPEMESILKETFGIMVYQEQVLQIARKVAGYSLGGADLLRRAMGKKIPEEMERQRKVFIEGTLRHCGGTEEVAGHLFDNIEKFAGYAFNKAHATTYALISYQTAYVKANYPVEFLCANLIHESHNTDKLQEFIEEAKIMGIPILSPDINASQVEFSIEVMAPGPKISLEAKEGEKDFLSPEECSPSMAIRYGLNALKGVGTGVMEVVLEERRTKGLFKDIFDFMERCQSLGINKKNLESLIMAGALDSLHNNRAQLMTSVSILLKPMAPPLEDVLFTLVQERPKLLPCTPWSPYEELLHERQAIGFYLHHHPLSIYENFPFTPWTKVKTIMEAIGVQAQEEKNRHNNSSLEGSTLKEKEDKTLEEKLSTKMTAFKEREEKNKEPKGSKESKDHYFFLMGMVMARVEKMSRSGYKYSFVTLSDPSGTYEVILFNPRGDEVEKKKPKTWGKKGEEKHPGSITGIPGFINAGGENIQTWRNWLDNGSAVCLKACVRFSETPRLQVLEITPIESFYYPETLHFSLRPEKISDFLAYSQHISSGPSTLLCSIPLCLEENLNFRSEWFLGSYNLSPFLRSVLWAWKEEKNQ